MNQDLSLPSDNWTKVNLPPEVSCPQYAQGGPQHHRHKTPGDSLRRYETQKGRFRHEEVVPKSQAPPVVRQQGTTLCFVFCIPLVEVAGVDDLAYTLNNTLGGSSQSHITWKPTSSSVNRLSRLTHFRRHVPYTHSTFSLRFTVNPPHIGPSPAQTHVSDLHDCNHALCKGQSPGTKNGGTAVPHEEKGGIIASYVTSHAGTASQSDAGPEPPVLLFLFLISALPPPFPPPFPRTL